MHPFNTQRGQLRQHPIDNRAPEHDHGTLAAGSNATPHDQRQNPGLHHQRLPNWPQLRFRVKDVTLVLLVRHGLTAGTGKVLTGRTPGIPLDDRGLLHSGSRAESGQQRGYV